MVPCTGFICECTLCLYKGNFAGSCWHVLVRLHVVCHLMMLVCVCLRVIRCLGGSNTVWAHSGAFCQQLLGGDEISPAKWVSLCFSLMTQLQSYAEPTLYCRVLQGLRPSKIPLSGQNTSIEKYILYLQTCIIYRCSRHVKKMWEWEVKVRRGRETEGGKREGWRRRKTKIIMTITCTWQMLVGMVCYHRNSIYSNQRLT